MAVITWSAEGDFDRDDVYETDLTAYIERPGQGVVIDRAMGPTGTYRAGRLSLALSNKDGTFTPENTASSLHGDLRPGVPIRIRATHNSLTYTQYVGYWMSGSWAWRAGQVPMAYARVDDLAAWLQKYTPVDLSTAQRVTGTAMTSVASEIGLAGGDYTFDAGQQTMPVHFIEGQNALQAFIDIARAELGGLFYVLADGTLRFEDRVSRLGVASLDDTWGDGTNITPNAIEYIFAEDETISKIELRANIYVTNPATEVLFQFTRNAENSESLELTAGQVYGPVRMDFGIPVSSITTPAASIDYTANTAADGSGTDSTSDLTVTVTLQGAGYELTLENTGASTLYVTKFEIRGIGEEFITDNPTFFVEKSIPNDKIDRGAQIQVPFAEDVALLRDFAHGILRTYRYPYPALILRFTANHDDAKAALLDADIGDKIKYKDTAVGVDFETNGTAAAFVDDWFYITGIQKRIPPHWAGNSFEATVRLEPSYLFFDPAKMVYDSFNRDAAVGDLGTSFSGDTWANDGNFDVNALKARANSDTLQMPNLDLGPSATDQVVEVDLAAIGAGDEVGVVWRYQDANNQYRAYVDKGSNEVIVEKNVATVVTELSSPALTVGTSHEMRVMMQGSRIRVWVDMKLYVDTTDSALTTGTKVGLFARNANATCQFDDFHGRRI